MEIHNNTLNISEKSLLSLFACIAPEPTETQIKHEYAMDHQANPYNDNYGGRPKKRDTNEIIADLRWEFARTMMARRDTPSRRG